VNCGGKFTDFEGFAAIVRTLSRRDLTAAIAFTTLFWSFLTWMAGTEAQKQRLSHYIRHERGAMGLGYSEKEHGSDLVGGGLIATKVPGGYLLNGEKWPINRATLSGLVYILARMDGEEGAKSLSLFMVEKSQLSPSGYYNLPKVLTHGIRGSDISGIGFRDCFVPEATRLGEEGDGLELALKGFQITRPLCAAFSLGSADTALRTTLRFALDRQLYRQTVFDLPQPRHTLADAFLDILVAECVTLGALRGFSIVPEQFSVWGAVVKYFVPSRLEKMVNDVSVVLGSRFYMREEFEWGIFQKVLRDNAIISMFDGSSIVNLHALVLQFRQLTKHRARRDDRAMEALRSRLEMIFSLEKPLPPFVPRSLDLFGRGADDSPQGLEIAIHQLKESSADPEIKETLLALSEMIREELDLHDEFIARSKFEFGHGQEPELFEIAKKYCTLHAATSCLHIWIYNREFLGGFFARGEWLVLSLHRLLRSLRPLPHTINPGYRENLARELVELYRAERLFSLLPLPLARTDVPDHSRSSMNTIAPSIVSEAPIRGVQVT
jgi:alkylation response protein AidB-like acyl-CoA dehydrogenase